MKMEQKRKDVMPIFWLFLGRQNFSEVFFLLSSPFPPIMFVARFGPEWNYRRYVRQFSSRTKLSFRSFSFSGDAPFFVMIQSWTEIFGAFYFPKFAIHFHWGKGNKVLIVWDKISPGGAPWIWWPKKIKHSSKVEEKEKSARTRFSPLGFLNHFSGHAS